MYVHVTCMRHVCSDSCSCLRPGVAALCPQGPRWQMHFLGATAAVDTKTLPAPTSVSLRCCAGAATWTACWHVAMEPPPCPLRAFQTSGQHGSCCPAGLALSPHLPHGQDEDKEQFSPALRPSYQIPPCDPTSSPHPLLGRSFRLPKTPDAWKLALLGPSPEHLNPRSGHPRDGLVSKS